MRYILFFTFIFCKLSTANCQYNNYWQQKVDYTIDVQLDDKQHSLEAVEKLVYTNNSPDTLRFIWFHLWANAYKNDKTAFSEQMLRNGRTDFYFTTDSNKGYINQLAFKINGTNAVAEVHPANIDIVKVLLLQPLFPGQSVTITTPFHVQLPYNFSRGGHVGQSYQATQWYPKPAVYDSKGWHEMPYLDQGEFYSEFGSFDVKITVPENYIVAASGQLQNADELEKLKQLSKLPITEQPNYLYFQNAFKKKYKTQIKSLENLVPPSIKDIKILHYQLNNAHDFAWFASKQFVVQNDTVILNNKTVDIFTFYNPWNEKKWQTSMAFAKAGLRFYSNQLGDYPYANASVVSGADNLVSGGMEYPTITLITTQSSGQELDATIAHELGHNWFYAALASNERDHAWMDEGMNSFYEKKYINSRYPLKNNEKDIENNTENLLIEAYENIYKDQAIDQTSDTFTSINYGLFVYTKASKWMQQLEKQLGGATFKKVMQTYYQKWQFKHPYPLDFKQVIEATSQQKIDSLYQKLFTTKAEEKATAISKKKLQFNWFAPLNTVEKSNVISFSPIAGLNHYDKLMIGALVHNYQVPLQRFQFVAAPMYAIGSKGFNVFARASYNIFKKHSWLEISSSVAKYSINSFQPEKADKLYLGLTRLVPSIKYTLYNKDLRSTEKISFQLRTFLLKQDNLQFKTITIPTGNIDVVNKVAENTYINQLKINWDNNRVLYPYNTNLTIDQSSNFIRAGFTGNYFFNYESGKGGINARFFAGKFFYLQSKTFITSYETEHYHLNLSAPKGNEDYTFSNYFIGRNEFEGLPSQQIMERDGFFKVNTDLYSSKVGKTDNWLMALNFSGDIPSKINPLQVLPIKIPLKFFVDIGTYAEAWQDNSNSGKFLYDAGLQLPLFKDLVNIYFPILSSKIYRDYNKSVLGEGSFWKTVSFSIDIQKLKLNKLSKYIPL
ncbi:MAG: hypothetical protein H7068_00865 [Pedobacter sp.]|nr:hypothetical protein [Chitinophagaceae bacterium]